MATPVNQMPAADGSDIIAVQTDTNPSGGTQFVVVRGYPIDQGGYIAGLKVTNTQVGEFSGNH